MLTQCPSCQTVFRVTSTILRAAHGQVRCGRCNFQFDAIEQLLEGEEAASANEPDTSANDTATNKYDPGPIPHEDIVLEGNRIEISGVYRRPDDSLDDDVETHSRTVIEEFNIDADEWPSPLEEPAVANSDDLDAAETELEDVEQEISAAEIADAMASLEAPSLAAKSVPDNAVETDAPQTESTPRPPPISLQAPESGDALPDDTLFTASPTPRRWPWAVASITLVLLLMVQTVHHARAALARHPGIGPPLSKLYTAIGKPLAPQWQLQAYSIKQWGIISDPQEPGTLRVRASVTNGAGFAQPYPLLQLSLEDRFGGKVGSRNFKPEEYLSSQALATRLLGAGEAANVDLAIVDPGQEAVGFQFDTCLPLADNQLHCTHDLPAL